ncbi:MAG: HD domain-containing protein [Chloroflexota bacterium]
MNYKKVWQATQPYMWARRNNIHIPICYHYAEQLVEAHPECDPDVVLLGIMLHDLGWATVDQEKITAKVLGTRVTDVRIQHEKEGARIAKEILDGCGYPKSLTDEICAIIDGHDTRLEALSLNDSLVKDADKLWRFNPIGITVATEWFEWTPARYAAKVETTGVFDAAAAAAARCAAG